MTIIRPRITDFHNILISQSEIDFAIPFLNEDIPLYVDPFLLWKSPSYQDKSLHGAILNSFNQLGWLVKKNKTEIALDQLIISSECNEVGLGHSARRKGKRIGKKQAIEILRLFEIIPQYDQRGFSHFEEIQFFVDGISKDRISDIACSFMKSFLIDFTIDQCENLNIPLSDCTISHLYNLDKYSFDNDVTLQLPINPDTNEPILFVPKRWLRFTPWINFDDYFKEYCPRDEIINPGEKLDRVKVLNYNRQNYGVIEVYIKEKERTFDDCKNDPLFTQIPVLSAKKKFASIKKLPSGKDGNADKSYEDFVCQMMPSLLYPHLDFATEQSRTISGTLIRDLIFYNNRSNEFLKEIYDDYSSTQIVMELKNVKSIEREHINQLNRYMTDSLGKFGILVTRNEISKSKQKNTIDLWSGQRRCIITLTDMDLEQMVEIFESKQRLPLDVIKKKYVDFRRKCPS
ncbi:hypothetical protein KJ966_17215 [bacterium]|nr:hypothetical protein [bacterium]